MRVLQLLEEVHHRVPTNAPFGTRWKAAAEVTLPDRVHLVAVAARIDRQGQRREQFWCDGVRVERAVWLRLTCPERECPHAVQVRAQWNAFHGRARTAALPGPPLAQAPALMVETVVTVGRQQVTARPARFPCFTPCPHRAHPPLTIEKSGFDLFDNGLCLGGGVTESQGVRRPRIPTLPAAEAYVLARQLETMAAVGAARGSLRGRPGPPDDAG